MITAAKLKTRTVKDLAAMAKRKRILGWHSMRKDDLVRALLKHAKAAARSKSAQQNGRSKSRAKKASTTQSNGAKRAKTAKPVAKPAAKKPTPKKPTSPYARRKLNALKKKLTVSKDLALNTAAENGSAKDRLVAMVRDPYWLHAHWELSRRSVDRAKVALGQHWHEARPVLRLNKVARNGTTNSARRVIRDIVIHGGVNNWYVDVQDPPGSYLLEIGYLAGKNNFFCLARSNVVTTPRPGSSESFDKNWSEEARDFDRVYAMSGGHLDQEPNRELKELLEERLRRPMGDPSPTRFGRGAAKRSDDIDDFNFEVETELIVHGVTEPDAHVTLRGEPVHLRSDGTFAVRFTLPDRRHVLPVVASSGDGVEQHTIVLAVDRNTKVMEPVIRHPGE